jgi:hypothetical protein
MLGMKHFLLLITMVSASIVDCGSRFPITHLSPIDIVKPNQNVSMIMNLTVLEHISYGSMNTNVNINYIPVYSVSTPLSDWVPMPLMIGNRIINITGQVPRGIYGRVVITLRLNDQTGSEFACIRYMSR